MATTKHTDSVGTYAMGGNGEVGIEVLLWEEDGRTLECQATNLLCLARGNS